MSFPGEVWRTWVEDLYRGDALARGTFALSGKPARLEGVTCPLLVVTFEHDNIVPKASAADLYERAASSDKHALHLSGGHVGAVVSRGAAKKLWPALGDFWAARDSAPARSASGGRPSRPTPPEGPRGSDAERDLRRAPSRARRPRPRGTT